MTKEERNIFILDGIRSSNKVTITDLASQLKVSSDTIRRDIESLNKQGLLVKVRGGAIAPRLDALSFQERLPLYSKAKDIIAIKALRHITNGQTIFMDGGTTAIAIALRLPKDVKLTVITNNPEIIPHLNQHELIKIIVIGGTYNRQAKTNVGIQSCREIQKYSADLYFMGACSIDVDFGIRADIMEDGEVKQAFLQASNKTLVLANKEKIGQPSFFTVCPIHAVDGLITDLESDNHLLNPFRHKDLEII